MSVLTISNEAETVLRRYATWDEAERGHNEVVERLRAALGPEGD